MYIAYNNFILFFIKVCLPGLANLGQKPGCRHRGFVLFSFCAAAILSSVGTSPVPSLATLRLGHQWRSLLLEVSLVAKAKLMAKAK